MKKMKTYRFKLKPTPAQEQIFAQWLGSCRFVYNLCLEYKQLLYNQYRKSIGKNDLQKQVKQLIAEVEWLQTLHSQTMQDVTDRLENAYQRFFKQGAGFPKFAKRSTWKSFSFKQGVKIKSCDTVFLPKIGEVKFHASQEIAGVIKRTSIVKQATGWYICFACELEIQPLASCNKSIGIDVGLAHVATLSDGTKIENPRILQKRERKLKQLQRSISRKKKGSNNRKKAVRNVARHHEKTTNIRKDFLHKLTTWLIRENQTIAVEELQIQNMMQNHRLAKAIADASWSKFVEMLAYKSEWYGRELKKVPARNTSRMCSNCGYIKEQMSLGERAWSCPQCGAHHDRDTNASKNILAKSIGGRADRVSLEDIHRH
jgi:putative transposase